MTNKKSNTLLVGITMIIAFAIFAFTVPGTVVAANAEFHIDNNSGLSTNANASPAHVVSPKCGSKDTKVEKKAEKKAETKCGGKNAKVEKKMEKKADGKCGGKNAKVEKKVEKKVEGKCGKGKAGDKGTKVEKKAAKKAEGKSGQGK